ncbi:hypothetical protein AXG93_1748s1260 [Marchantia polymorpha subsp. ruderalis]|uniref:Plant heme peroxidase family profile domain-containing protein n=1 Tax=Marchantia polymorpha subsp. ruderalis TaxID=1480154 RepID=A0A176VIW9_MARPO|nr:hypothetical protein AXG93_1748s1260 [Marchantia polymorpha subsp. ruderalis]
MKVMADTNLPFPESNISQLVVNLAAKGLNAREMATLSVAHTIGRAHCNGVLPHLLNFTRRDDATDTHPAKSKNFSTILKNRCNWVNRTNTVSVDSTANTFGREYYKNLLQAAMVKMGKVGMLTGTQGEFGRSANS